MGEERQEVKRARSSRVVVFLSRLGGKSGRTEIEVKPRACAKNAAGAAV